MQGKVGDHDKTGCSLQCLAAKSSKYTHLEGTDIRRDSPEFTPRGCPIPNTYVLSS